MKRIEFEPGAEQANLTEKQFQRQVVDLARTLGWTTYHTTYSIGSDRGYPDLTLVHPELGVLWLELKGPRGRTTDEQVEWITTLRQAGQRAYVVKPMDITWIAELLMGNDIQEQTA